MAKRTYIKRAAIILASTTLVLLALELGLRAAGYCQHAALYFDQDIGWRFLPNQHREMGVGRDEVMVEFFINEHGYRGPMPFERADRSVLRVACLGDSWTFGWNAPEEGTYPVLLQRALEERLGAGNVEVLNFGVPGYNGANSLATYEHVVRSFEPDVVVHGFFLNDIAPAGRGARNTDGPLFRLLGRTALAEAFHRHLRNKLELFKNPRSPELIELTQGYKVGNKKMLHLQPESEDARPYWDRALAELDELIAALRADGVAHLIAVFPADGQVSPLRDAFITRGEEFDEEYKDLSRPQALLRERMEQAGAHVTDLLPAFVRAEEAPMGSKSRTHPSEDGYALIAEVISEHLMQLEELQRRR